MVAPLVVAKGVFSTPWGKRALWAVGGLAVAALSRTELGKTLVNDLKDGVNGMCEDIERDYGVQLRDANCDPYDKHAKR